MGSIIYILLGSINGDTNSILNQHFVFNSLVILQIEISLSLSQDLSINGFLEATASLACILFQVRLVWIESIRAAWVL